MNFSHLPATAISMIQDDGMAAELRQCSLGPRTDECFESVPSNVSDLSRRGGSGKCYVCGGAHFARECPNSGGGGGAVGWGSGGGGGGGGRFGGGGGGGGGDACFTCGRPGHRK